MRAASEQVLPESAVVKPRVVSPARVLTSAVELPVLEALHSRFPQAVQYAKAPAYLLEFERHQSLCRWSTPNLLPKPLLRSYSASNGVLKCLHSLFINRNPARARR